MKIGIVGAGMIGGTMGRLWAQAGHQVRFGTRHPEALDGLVRELGARASAGSAEEALSFGEAILLAVPLKAVPELAQYAAAFAGKVVLDATNPYPQRDGDSAREALADPRGSSGWVASHLPGARVVKAFNTVYFKVLASEAHRPKDPVAIPIASDDRAALEVADRLVRDAGFAPVNLGGLAKGKSVEPGSPVYNTGASEMQVRKALGL